MKKLFSTILLVVAFVFGTLVLPSVTDASDLRTSLSGRILLAVEENGEAWYVEPGNHEKYFLGKPIEAFNLMQQVGLGISNRDFNSFNGKAPSRLSGKILLKVEDEGKAYYVNPLDLKLYFLGRPADAFQLMRKFGLGITNSNLALIPSFANGVIPSIKVDFQTTKYDNVVINEVSSRAKGWIVIYKVINNTESGEIVGQSAVNIGINRNVNVRLIGVNVGQDLIAMLHYDLGQIGVFEYFGPDVPVELNNEIVMKKFFTTHADSVGRNVQIINSTFSPRNITVKRGTPIVWTNYDNIVHTIVADSFQSSSLGFGKTFNRVFNEVGVFNYHSSLHPNMTGTVTVVAE